jgi:catechol 2,3-dioxygenase-like lactoylglutathione lyase family enzyme
MPIDSGLRTILQVAVVCRDIEATARRWASLLGVDTPKVFTTDPGNQCGMTYRGRSSDARCKLAFFNLGACDLELIQPLGPESSWQDALDKNGECVHHFGFGVTDLNGTVRTLADQGMPVIHQGHFDGKRGTYAYIDSQKQLGVMIELLHSDKSSAT